MLEIDQAVHRLTCLQRVPNGEDSPGIVSGTARIAEVQQVSEDQGAQRAQDAARGFRRG